MTKKEIREFFVNLKNLIDSHISSGTLISSSEVPKDIVNVCNDYIKANKSPSPQFLNEVYLSILFYESCRDKVNKDVEFLNITDKHFVKKRNSYEGLEKQMYTEIILMNLNRIIVEDYT